jgi:predicted N-acetyltransferase YhbS
VDGQTQGGLICRPARPDDQAAVTDLLSVTFDGWHGELNEAMWSWKFLENPHGQALIWVADDEGRIAGCYILNPVMLRVGDTTVPGAQSVDAAVSTEYRGRGVFSSLAKAALKDATDRGIRLVFAFPTQGAVGGQVRVGYKRHSTVPKTHRPLAWPARRRRFDGFTLGHAHAFDERFDVFSERGNDGEISVQRDAGYLEWRYNANPTQSYETITCERDGQLCGYCVLDMAPAGRKLSQGYIIDMQVLPQSPSAAQFLVYQAIARLRSLGARAAMSWDRPGGPEQEALKAFGFSSRYVSIKRRLTRPPYVDEFIYYDGRGAQQPQLNGGAAHSALWSLVPGDFDAI